MGPRSTIFLAIRSDQVLKGGPLYGLCVLLLW